MYTVDILFKNGELKNFQTTDLTSFNALVEQARETVNVLTEFYISPDNLKTNGLVLEINFFNASDRVYKGETALVPKYQGIKIPLVEAEEISSVDKVVVNSQDYLIAEDGELVLATLKIEQEFNDVLKNILENDLT